MVDFQLNLTRYANERFLYRLSKSPHAKNFILKGAMLFLQWDEERLFSLRPSRDIDFLGLVKNETDVLQSVMGEIIHTQVISDGLVFDESSISIHEIREGQKYPGVRVKMVCRLGKVRIPIQIDIGFGDNIPLPAETIQFPTLLDFPKPRINVYPKVCVISEKLESMVQWGMATSRMKDFYDLYTISNRFNFKGEELFAAIKLTFQSRDTPIPATIPMVFTEEFSEDSQKKKQWHAFIHKNRIDISISFASIIMQLNEFITPVLNSLKDKSPFNKFWHKGGPWGSPKTKIR